MSDDVPHSETRSIPKSDADKFLEFYQEHERLRGVVTSELQRGGHGSFLQHFLLAYAHTDNSNARLLQPVMQELEKKYKLEDHFLNLQKHKTEDKTAEEPGLT